MGVCNLVLDMLLSLEEEVENGMGTGIRTLLQILCGKIHSGKVLCGIQRTGIIVFFSTENQAEREVSKGPSYHT